MGTATLLGQLAQDRAFGGRDAALAAVPATADLVGALSADSLRITARTSFLVQNSGSAGQRAGFSAGPGGLQVAAGTDTALDMVINGQVTDGTGTVFVNADTLGQVARTGGFTPQSSVNGCLVSGEACTNPQDSATATVVGAIVTNIVNLADKQADELDRRADDTGTAAEKLPQARIARLVDLGESVPDAVITDPVTGDGNPALWLDTLDVGTRPPETPK